MNITGPLPSMVPAFPPPNTGAAAGRPGSPELSGQSDSAQTSQSEENRRPESSGQASEARQQADQQGLEPEELKQLSELKARDREVRAHEAAHQAVGGQYAGAISYVFERGPDGAQYAVGGEVSIDTSPIQGDPQATIEKMRTVRAAALAPAQPSPQDRSVASQASQAIIEAQAQLAAELGAQSDDPSADQEGATTRVKQGASNAYQSVFGLGNEASNQPSESFQASA